MKARRSPALVALVVLVVVLAPSAATTATAAQWQFEALTGQPFNFSSNLRVKQAGHPIFEHDPEWDSEPRKVPIYWDLRLTRRDGDRGWAIDLMHHKLVLENRTEEIGWFSISHGYNILTLQRRWWRGPWHAAAGAGAVIAHPESEVRGRRWDETGGLFDGEYLAGWATLVAAGREWFPRRWLGLNAEARFTLSRVLVDIVDGEASLTHAGLHFLLGVSLRR